MEVRDIILGIDPDIEKSGIAIGDLNNGETILTNWTLYHLFCYLEENKGRIIKVYVEQGELNKKANFHRVLKQQRPGLTGNQLMGIAEATAAKVGMNFAVARLILETCEILKVPAQGVRPVMSKMDAPTFQKYFGLKGKNQEQRDAFVMIAGRYKHSKQI